MAETGTAVSASDNAVSNNNLSLPGGLAGYGLAASTLGTSMLDAGATPEEINAALSKNAQGDLPEDANIAKVIVEGYTDGVLAAGAWYLGPAATAGKVVAGSAIGAIANGTYQWFDINQPGNENKTWDYKSSGNAAITGMLAPGRGIWQNMGIAAAGSVFTDGANAVAVSSAAAGAWAGGKFGELAPGVVNSVIGKELPGVIYDIGGVLLQRLQRTQAKISSKSRRAGNDKKCLQIHNAFYLFFSCFFLFRVGHKDFYWFYLYEQILFAI